MARTRDIHDVDMGPPAGFFMIGGGMFAVVGGLACLGAAYRQAFLRYQAREYAPVVKEVLADVAPGLAQSAGAACPRCRTDNPAGAKFCTECGAEVGARACGKCGTANPVGGKFCTECGTGL